MSRTTEGHIRLLLSYEEELAKSAEALDWVSVRQGLRNIARIGTDALIAHESILLAKVDEVLSQIYTSFDVGCYGTSIHVRDISCIVDGMRNFVRLGRRRLPAPFVRDSNVVPIGKKPTDKDKS